MTDRETWQVGLITRYYRLRAVLPKLMHFPASGAEVEQRIFLVTYSPGGFELERLDWEVLESLIEVAEDLIPRIQPGKEIGNGNGQRRTG